jgi:hypothetical protein
VPPLRRRRWRSCSCDPSLTARAVPLMHTWQRGVWSEWVSSSMVHWSCGRRSLWASSSGQGRQRWGSSPKFLSSSHRSWRPARLGGTVASWSLHGPRELAKRERVELHQAGRKENTSKEIVGRPLTGGDENNLWFVYTTTWYGSWVFHFTWAVSGARSWEEGILRLSHKDLSVYAQHGCIVGAVRPS